MFIFMATEQLRRFVRREDKILPDKHKNLGPVTLQGMRYQLFRALRAMACGELMVVEHRIPSLADHFENDTKREAWFRLLRKTSSWEEQDSVEPVLVPGTAYPRVVGRILLHSGWCAPCEHPHWVPNLRFFFLTELGHKSFDEAQVWWSGQTAMARVRLIILE